MITRVCSECKNWQPQDRERSHSGLCILANRATAFNDGCMSYEPFQETIKPYSAGKDYSKYYTNLGYHPSAQFNGLSREEYFKEIQ